MSQFAKLISYFLRSSRSPRDKAMVVLILAAGILSGMAGTSLIALINGTLNGSRQGSAFFAGWFIGLLVLLPVLRFGASALLVRISQQAFHELRMDLCRRILSAPLRRLEQYGSARLLASLTDDVGTIGGALGTLPTLLMHLTIVICCLAYMVWLSWPLFLLVLVFLVVGLITYQLPMKQAQRQFFAMRQDWDGLMGHLRGLTEGTKELKLHSARRRSFLREMVAGASASLRQHTIAGNTLYSAAANWGYALFFVLIGAILYVAPRITTVEPPVLTGFTLAILYMLNPLDMILSLMPGLGRANIAIRRIEELGGDLAANVDDRDDTAPALETASWSRLELAGVTHSYFREKEEDHFTLGPIHLKVGAGELIFLVGGNGSGKTTLAKLITGLYVPEQGEIQLDGIPVSDENRELYRQHFSVVFQDFYIFEHLIGLATPQLDEDARNYIEMLDLERKVKVENGKLSTIDLSRGQRKRLALLTAYLENRSIYLFDEWAADQDPQFKELFYLQLLPQLRERGKTVIVISHDDRYYELADRIIKLDYGRVEFDGLVPDYLEAYGHKDLQPAVKQQAV
jgi:putative pyoverdin transport system ATP-binding/permease protein